MKDIKKERMFFLITLFNRQNSIVSIVDNVSYDSWSMGFEIQRKKKLYYVNLLIVKYIIVLFVYTKYCQSSLQDIFLPNAILK